MIPSAKRYPARAGTGLWILDLKGILLIYPESNIEHPASARLKQSDIYAANLS
jgi:hypothetical protein